MTDVFDKHYKRYDAWYDKNNYAYLSELEAVKQALPAAGKGLEIGVGTGRFASLLGIRYGVEPSVNMANIARKRGVQVYLGYGSALPFIDNSFDYAAIIITLCFIKDPKQALSESYRVLRKRGKIIIGIIDKDSFLGKFYIKKKSLFYRQARFFNIKDVSGMLEKARFRNLSYCQTLFALPDRINAVERFEKGFGKGGFVVVSAEKHA